jgi:hypothetical protein
MKRSSRTRKTSVDLSESISRQLNVYALAASSAGVGMLALAQGAEAKIVYTPISAAIGTNGMYQLDLDRDRNFDFTINNSEYHRSSGDRHSLFVSAAAANGVAGQVGKYGFLASALKAGAHIPNSRKFGSRAKMAFNCSGTQCFTHSSRTSGNWVNVTNRYLGLRFKIKGKIHYGWARLSVQYVRFITLSATLTGYAYETIPNKPIVAGQTKGPDEIGLEPEATLTAPISSLASLGVLAMGAPGLSIWRREVSAVAER